MLSLAVFERLMLTSHHHDRTDQALRLAVVLRLVRVGELMADAEPSTGLKESVFVCAVPLNPLSLS